LAWRLGVPLEKLRQLESEVRTNYVSQYTQFALETGKSTKRIIRPPRKELKAVQRLIVKRILQPLGLSDSAHGGVIDRSPATNARVHLGTPCVVTLDVKTFFDSVDHRRVYRMLRDEHRFGHDVARLITRLTTLRGSLPQGAPTSPAVANLFLSKAVDGALVAVSNEKKLNYSRFVDDLTLSGTDPTPLVGEVAQLLSARGLRLNRRKISVSSNGTPQRVTGLLVNASERLSIPRARRDAIRVAIHQLGVAALSDAEADARVRSIVGRIAHVERFHPGDGRRLRALLDTKLTARREAIQ
jgi:hypothetical protein